LSRYIVETIRGAQSTASSGGPALR